MLCRSQNDAARDEDARRRAACFARNAGGPMTGRFLEKAMLPPLVVLACVLAPGAAWAQSTIAGLVTDATGAVLPGVVVEASSPALIEKARSAVTDGDGRYSVIDIRPGVYTVTFTLPGFNTVRREGVE